MQKAQFRAFTFTKSAHFAVENGPRLLSDAVQNNENIILYVIDLEAKDVHKQVIVNSEMKWYISVQCVCVSVNEFSHILQRLCVMNGKLMIQIKIREWKQRTIE